MEEITVNIPPVVRGVDMKWIVRSFIANMLACVAVNETQNAYGDSLMIIRDRVWPTFIHGKGVRGDLATWQEFRTLVCQWGAGMGSTWDGYGYTGERAAVDRVIHELAVGESSDAVAMWWRTFDVDTF